MRRILVDHARARHYQKRGSDAAKVTFDEGLVVTAERAPVVVVVDVEVANGATGRFQSFVRAARASSVRFDVDAR